MIPPASFDELWKDLGPSFDHEESHWKVSGADRWWWAVRSPCCGAAETADFTSEEAARDYVTMRCLQEATARWRASRRTPT